MHELGEILGDYRAFFEEQNRGLRERGIDISGCAISHLAYRTASLDDYLKTRDALEDHCAANVENVWNGRRISKLLLREPMDLGDGFENCLIELIPPPHQNLYKMGLEHTGVVIGEAVDKFSIDHRARLTGQQFQSPDCEPYYVRFHDNHTMVKFYRYSLMDVCVKEGQRFDGFYHAAD